MITIRRAIANDAEALAVLNQEFSGVGRSRADIEKALDSSMEEVLVGSFDEQVVGFACLQVLWSFCYDMPWVELTELYVAPPFRHRGVGRALCEQVIQRANDVGAAQVLLRTGPANDAIDRVYRPLGFQPSRQILLYRANTTTTP
ncbi:MAG TPA: GNAT family N-acetyltransferase [Pyrinomonadaceae bacterium]|nr:GNAT family N-acetyltransferase [Pyrinomonadaceae bacterium]